MSLLTSILLHIWLFGCMANVPLDGWDAIDVCSEDGCVGDEVSSEAAYQDVSLLQTQLQMMPRQVPDVEGPEEAILLELKPSARLTVSPVSQSLIDWGALRDEQNAGEEEEEEDECESRVKHFMELANQKESSLMELFSCPSKCSTMVRAGNPGIGGVSLVGDVCTHTASKFFGSYRYCGSGRAYNEHEDSVDCSNCKVGHDLLFPPNKQSIASRDYCGDEEQHSKTCDKYNVWKTFQQVADGMSLTFSVVGDDEPQFSELVQGELESSYFLAALAAVAYNQPSVINDMFVERELWGQNIFKTKWHLGGRKQILMVDNMIPAGDSKPLFFTNPSSKGEFWPVVLAKTWAKAFGNFRAAESGVAFQVIKAMTGAPGRFIDMKTQTQNSIWQVLLEGTAGKHPMSANACQDCKGPFALNATGGTYAILEATSDESYGKVVKLYSPWARSAYTGVVRDQKEPSGVFTMLLSEFKQAFVGMTINYLKQGYKLTQVTIPANQLGAHEVTVSSPGKFWVSLAWPSRTMLQPCNFANPQGILSGELASMPGQPLGSLVTKVPEEDEVAASFENPDGGTYKLVAYEQFREDASWLKDISLVVYSPVAADIKEIKDEPETVALKMFGRTASDGSLCSTVTVPGWGVFTMTTDTESRCFDMPTYWNKDKTHFMFYVHSRDQWWVTTKEYLSRVQAGELWAHFKTTKAAMMCGCTDVPGGVRGFAKAIPCESVTNDKAAYHNLMCTGAQYSSYALSYCPRTCNSCE